MKLLSYKLYLVVIFFFVFGKFAFGQIAIRGQVLHITHKTPLPYATVYINNTTQKSQADSAGYFTVYAAKDSHIELVVSNIGYEVLTKPIFVNKESYHILYLSERVEEIEEIVVTAYDQNGWAKWGRYFHQNFIGLSNNAFRTKIKNTEVLRFRYNEQEKILNVSATAPLHIENEALGYKITYDLVSFTAYFNQNMVQFEGSSFFEETKNNRSVIENRRAAYQNSLNRFVRSIYQKSWRKDGYVVRKLQKFPNLEKSRADSLLKAISKSVTQNHNASWESYYENQKEYSKEDVQELRKRSREDEYFSVLSKFITEEDILTQTETGHKAIAYTDYIHVLNERIVGKENYIAQSGRNIPHTELIIVDVQNIMIDEYGNYAPGMQWMMSGFWGWYNKVSNLLPNDYEEF